MTFSRRPDTLPRKDSRLSVCKKLKQRLSHVHSKPSPPQTRLPETHQPPKRKSLSGIIPIKARPNDAPAQQTEIPAASLLGLPLELRNMIYTHLNLTNTTFHILWRADTHPTTAAHSQCSHPLPYRSPDYCTCLSGRPASHCYPRPTTTLLHVCRTLAAETLFLLYRYNTFAFGPDLNTFCLFTRTIGADNRRAIRDIKIVWPVSNYLYPAPYVRSPGLWTEGVPAWDAVRILRGGLGKDVRVRILLRESNPNFRSDDTGLWLRRYWFEPLTHVGAGSGEDARVVEVEVEPGSPDGCVGLAGWWPRLEDIREVVRRGEGLRRPWVVVRRTVFDVCVIARKARALSADGFGGEEEVAESEHGVSTGPFVAV